MKNPKDFEKSVNKSLKHIEAKLSYLRDGVKGLSDAFHEFQEEIGDYMSYSSEMHSEYDRRITRIEKELDL